MYREFIPEKFPTDLLCPIDPTTMEHFWFRMNNYLFGGHPNIRRLITGNLEPPLLNYESNINFKKDEATPAEYVCDYPTAEEDLIKMCNLDKEN